MSVEKAVMAFAGFMVLPSVALTYWHTHTLYG